MWHNAKIRIFDHHTFHHPECSLLGVIYHGKIFDLAAVSQDFSRTSFTVPT